MSDQMEEAGLHETEFQVRVRSVVAAAEDIVLVELGAVDPARPLPRWTAGSHIDVVLPGGGVRQYSLCGDPADADRWRIGVLREPAGRGGSAWIHEALHEGDTLRVAGPRNHFEFEPTQGTAYVFVAGGIGITPIAAMATTAQRAGVQYRIEYAGRSRSRMALLAELAELHGDRLAVHASDEGDHLDLDALFRDMPPFTTTYCCGPARMIDGIERASSGRQLVVERFEAKELGAPVRDEPFEVELATTGVTVTVPPDRSILEVAEEAGAFVLSSCREGTCGTCETAVLAGVPEHRDSILTPDEQQDSDVMYICVSRALSEKLTLDL